MKGSERYSVEASILTRLIVHLDSGQAGARLTKPGRAVIVGVLDAMRHAREDALRAATRAREIEGWQAQAEENECLRKELEAHKAPSIEPTEYGAEYGAELKGEGDAIHDVLTGIRHRIDKGEALRGSVHMSMTTGFPEWERRAMFRGWKRGARRVLDTLGLSAEFEAATSESAQGSTETIVVRFRPKEPAL